MTTASVDQPEDAAPLVDILLATYNGERFLAAQIDSILAQSNRDWRIIARDDGSTDGTRSILERYAASHPQRVMLLEDDGQGLGACGNFGRLMEHARSKYVMFCDQDDIWLPHKIDRLLGAARDLEAESGGGRALLVHSDLRVVDEELRTMHPSFWRYQSIDTGPGWSLNRLLKQNVGTGCAMLCSRRLVELALPIPPEALIHDWWLALVARAVGQVAVVEEPTVLYRQHGANTFGAQSFGIRSVFSMATAPAAALKSSRRLIRRSQAQAAALLARCGNDMADRDREIVAGYATLPEKGFVTRRLQIFRYRFFPCGFLRKLVFLMLV